ncbi:DEAD/DEAH box helicase family protein [Azospirillum thermophilum]|uniref:DEAD/DEAH box helicase n=1 Tax=Azospirillum thermophilum TaxID=2202148 RepID=A0A2S2CLL8_9PROT|nr:DEAD/DEAH box helicase family protein [Azospirillum thermophilum]AWK85405.1 DEAD/DEAH box helicase [Azospirillum thermophilum]
MAPLKKAKPTVRFSDRLAVAQWMLDRFGASSLEELTKPLRDERYEGLDSNGEHHFLDLLLRLQGPKLKLAEERLRAYDQNIVRLTARLNQRREIRQQPAIRWKHFQWLSLMFIEHYLDRYFEDAEALKADLNGWIADFNARVGSANRIEPFEPLLPAKLQLNKLALWCATGAGKTLLMHANILQFQFYLDREGHKAPDHVVLLTPNDGLSAQHHEEMEQAGIQSEIYSREGMTLFRGNAVEIIAIHKLREKDGRKTVSVDTFEGTNLVLVDEGHRGLGRGDEGVWLDFRERLCRDGFSFEYSATFQQAISESPRLTDLYAKAILVNYSYRYFYGDGFGKDYSILNLDEDTEKGPHLDSYLVGCLMAFFQQMELYERNREALKPFNIARPLWVFVGATVTGKKAEKEEAADVVRVVEFLARFTGRAAEMVRRIDGILQKGLVNAKRQDLFGRRFDALHDMGLGAEAIYCRILALLFNAPDAGTTAANPLRVVYRKGPQELALHVGVNPAFGVVNVGDPKGLFDQFEAAETAGQLDRAEETVGSAPSLFAGINRPGSTVTLLVGSRKFTEGWSSWRVSTMGLMNLGKSEGAQVIQLFGRGVRLRGLNDCLKRTREIVGLEKPPAPPYLAELETLNVFGIRASYMQAFADYLDEEQITKESETEELVVPVVRANPFPAGLKTLRVADEIDGVRTEFGAAFRKLARIPTLAPPQAGDPDDPLRKHPVVLNWYPRIAALRSRGVAGDGVEAVWERTVLPKEAVHLLDLDALWFELERFKAERGWFNLNIPRPVVAELLGRSDWYLLYAPPAELALDDLDGLPAIRDIALALLRRYTEHFYLYAKNAFEGPHRCYAPVDETDPSIRDYRFRIRRDDPQARARISELKAFIVSGRLRTDPGKTLQAVRFGRHLFQPLVHFTGNTIEVTPAALNPGEWRFVIDLMDYCDRNPPVLAGCEVYCLRNISGGRGVSFFEAGNYQPDFIVWVCHPDGSQDILFVDPKGIRQFAVEDDKIKFYKTIKQEERERNDPKVRLHAFILAVPGTDVAEMSRKWKMTKADMEDHHVLFLDDGGPVYLPEMFRRAGLSAEATAE